MSTKVFNTRLQLKYAPYSEWSAEYGKHPYTDTDRKHSTDTACQIPKLSASFCLRCGIGFTFLQHRKIDFSKGINIQLSNIPTYYACGIPYCSKKYRFGYNLYPALLISSCIFSNAFPSFALFIPLTFSNKNHSGLYFLRALIP